MPYFIYILTNKSNTLYVGVTGNLKQRMEQHIRKSAHGFTAKYNINKLIYYEEFPTANEAITAEKRLKGWTRKKKIALVKTINPRFEDLLKGT